MKTYCSEKPLNYELDCVHIQEQIKFCGFTFKYFKASSFLPEDFMKEHRIDPEWSVSVQHGKDYKHMLKLISLSFQADYEIKKQEELSEVR